MLTQAQQIQELRERLELLERENAELRSRLGQTSRNSHRPPSSDGYRKKTTRAALPKPQGKPCGGQPRHSGKTFERSLAVDEVVEELPKQCWVCQREFTRKGVRSWGVSRQVFDLPAVRLRVTEHRLAEVCCCEQIHLGEFAAHVSASVQYGPNLRALATKLSIEQRLPSAQVAGLLNELSGTSSSERSLELTLQKAVPLSKPSRESIAAELRQSDILHFDETGVRVAGQLQGLHVASNAQGTQLMLHSKRGQEALQSKASLWRDFRGVVVHDCWSAYFDEGRMRHALCGAHLLRELAALQEQGSTWAAGIHEFLLGLHENSRRAPPAASILREYRRLFEQADAAEP